jgi:hypothetical protein
MSVALSGYVQFYDNGAKLGSVAVTAGTATLKLAANALIGGTHSITAAFLGSTNFTASGPTAAQTITVNPASTSVTASDTMKGTSVTFAGTVSNTGGTSPTPAGQIQIMNGNTVLATVTLTANGTFSKALTLAHGTYTITVLYVPTTNAQSETNFLGSSTTLTFTV